MTSVRKLESIQDVSVLTSGWHAHSQFLQGLRRLCRRLNVWVCLILLLFTLQGRSWQRSMFIAQCLTMSLQSSLLSSFLTLGVMHLPTSTASWASSTIRMTMNSNAMKHATLQTFRIFLFRKIQQLIKVYIAKMSLLWGICSAISFLPKSHRRHSSCTGIDVCAVLEATWSC